MSPALPPLIPHFSTLAPDYDVLLCDVWGVVHNGVTAFPHACDALMRARARGATVVLHHQCAAPERGGGAPARQTACPARDLRRHRLLRRRHPRRDASSAPGRAVSISGRSATARSSPGSMCVSRRWSSADFVVCSGLDDDDVETPDDYRARLETMLERKLFMVCGNPDVVVERGDTAGLLRRLDRRSLRHHGRRGALCRQALSADLRHGAGQGGSRGRPQGAAQAACWRSAIRCAPISKARAPIGVDFLFVTVGHSRRGTGRARAARQQGAERHVRRRRRNAESGDAAIGVVKAQAAGG